MRFLIFFWLSCLGIFGQCRARPKNVELPTSSPPPPFCAEVLDAGAFVATPLEDNPALDPRFRYLDVIYEKKLWHRDCIISRGHPLPITFDNTTRVTDVLVSMDIQDGIGEMFLLLESALVQCRSTGCSTTLWSEAFKIFSCSSGQHPHDLLATGMEIRAKRETWLTLSPLNKTGNLGWLVLVQRKTEVGAGSGEWTGCSEGIGKRSSQQGVLWAAVILSPCIVFFVACFVYRRNRTESANTAQNQSEPLVPSQALVVDRLGLLSAIWLLLRNKFLSFLFDPVQSACVNQQTILSQRNQAGAVDRVPANSEPSLVGTQSHPEPQLDGPLQTTKNHTPWKSPRGKGSNLHHEIRKPLLPSVFFA